MSIPTSVLTEFLQAIPHWRPQMYFKASLTALSHAMEDQVLSAKDQPLVIACFQRAISAITYGLSQPQG